MKLNAVERYFIQIFVNFSAVFRGTNGEILRVRMFCSFYPDVLVSIINNSSACEQAL